MPWFVQSDADVQMRRRFSRHKRDHAALLLAVPIMVEDRGSAEDVRRVFEQRLLVRSDVLEAD